MEQKTEVVEEFKVAEVKVPDVKVAEEIRKMEYEELAPVELKLVRWSIGIGVGALFILYWLSQALFPAGH